MKMNHIPEKILCFSVATEDPQLKCDFLCISIDWKFSMETGG